MICLAWFASGFSYYGLTLGVSSLSGNRYVNTTIMSLVEVPAILLLIPLCDSRLGRKYTVLDPPPLGTRDLGSLSRA